MVLLVLILMNVHLAMVVALLMLNVQTLLVPELVLAILVIQELDLLAKISMNV
jgi:hypothetical protein